MTQSFQCPNCHAPLEYDEDRAAATVRCEYCNSTVIVPEELRRAGRQPSMVSGMDQAVVLAETAMLVQRGEKIEAIKQVREAFGMGLKEAKDVVDAIERHETVHLGEISAGSVRIDVASGAGYPVTSGQAARSPWLRIGCVVLVLLIVGSFVVPLLLGGGALWWAGSQVKESGAIEAVQQVLEGTAVSVNEPTVPNVTETPAFAQIVLQFGGEEGVGPGFFNDTRRIAVDGAGNIYTGDYSNGRIQVFDADGNFLSQINAGEDLYMVAMTVDRNGVVYVAKADQVLRFDGVTGAALDPLPLKIRVGTMTTAPDGSVIIVAEDRLLRLDGRGSVTLDLADPFADIADFGATFDDVAVDGAGNLYVLGADTVYKLDSNGRFVNRIGSRGDGDDQFSTPPSSLAVDGQGRIYVNDFDGIKVFDGNGRYLDMIPFNGVAFDMLFTTQNQLLVMDRNGNRVLTYQLNQ
ncbi:MAG: ribosomal protein L7/L12 [Ardenticatenaceae bacterium]|nr:ribosomal protein L7/L12 [Ardenticatenaceae bacterium]MCB9445290.1 ribosomal protein L7/L12 [Ardenticatenaceae bacterium]